MLQTFQPILRLRLIFGHWTSVAFLLITSLWRIHSSENFQFMVENQLLALKIYPLFAFAFQAIEGIDFKVHLSALNKLRSSFQFIIEYYGCSMEIYFNSNCTRLYFQEKAVL